MAVASRAAAESPPEKPPKVVTAGDHVSGTTDELDGTVNPENGETTYWFEYGPTNKYESGKSATGTLKAQPAETTDVSETVTGMQAGWRYRLVAQNGQATVDGHEKIFSVKTGKKKANKTALNLPQPEPVLVGETLILSGTLTGTGNSNREVVLQESPYPYRSAYADVGAPTVTSAAGGFTFRVTHLAINTRFRVSTVSAPILLSKVVSGLAAVRVVLKVRTNKHNRGLVRLYGTVSPAEVGARIYFQLEKPPKPKLKPPSAKAEKPGKSESEKEKPPVYATKFATFVKAGTKSVSRFSLVTTIKAAGLYRAFVAVPPGPLTSGYSATIALRAAPGKHKKK
ncbi:MAG TPA: hypothetical protein VMD79_14730 [Solirubrobacteraceae bacterium]|nr:hypothetical protein [Solirubrobacteraceae bacterium]